MKPAKRKYRPRRYAKRTAAEIRAIDKEIEEKHKSGEPCEACDCAGRKPRYGKPKTV